MEDLVYDKRRGQLHRIDTGDPSFYSVEEFEEVETLTYFDRQCGIP